MCPVTLSIVATTLATTMAAAASAAGTAAAAVGGAVGAAASAAGGAVTGAVGTLGSALGIGGGAGAAGGAGGVGLTTVSGTLITAPTIIGTGAPIVGTAVPTVVTGSIIPTTATGILGTGITTGQALAGVTALVGVGQGIHQKKEADKRARSTRKAVEEEAATKQTIASNQASRAVREEAEAHTQDVLKGAEVAGVYKNLQNRSDVQEAAYLRQATRATQADQNARDLRVAAITGSARDATQNISVNRSNQLSQIRGGSNLGLGLAIGAAGVTGIDTHLRLK